jgi:hypothetical protein
MKEIKSNSGEFFKSLRLSKLKTKKEIDNFLDQRNICAKIEETDSRVSEQNIVKYSKIFRLNPEVLISIFEKEKRL